MPFYGGSHGSRRASARITGRGRRTWRGSRTRPIQPSRLRAGPTSRGPTWPCFVRSLLPRDRVGNSRGNGLFTGYVSQGLVRLFPCVRKHSPREPIREVMYKSVLLFLVLLLLHRAGVRGMMPIVRIIHAPVGSGVIDARVTRFELGLTRVGAVFGALERNSLLDAVRLAPGLSGLLLAVLRLLCEAERA